MSEATESTGTDAPADVSAEAAQRAGEQKPKVPGPGRVARAYFDAVAARDPDAMVECWAEGGITAWRR